MKKLNLIIMLLLLTTTSLWAQTAYNPFTQNIHFTPEPTAAGFGCGSTQSVQFTLGMTTADSATQWQTQPLKVKIRIGGFQFNGTNANTVVTSPTNYHTYFNWTFSPNGDTLIGTQNQTLYGTGSNPIFPDPRSSGLIDVALKVPSNSPVNTVLSVNVTLAVPTYMATFNSTGDDPEATQTQTFCALMLTGNVYNDVNGLTNSNVDGIGIGSPNSTQLFVNLVNAAGNVIATQPVSSNGTYTFNNVPNNVTLTAVLSTTQGTLGNPPPAATLPSGWVNTGEDCCDAIGSDGNINGVVTIVMGNTHVSNANFGIQQPPAPGTNLQPAQVNPGGTVNITVPNAAFSGTDPSGGTITSLKICTFPTNATSITINGNNYTSATFPAAGVVVPTNTSGTPSQVVTVDPITGAVTVGITYSVTDNALFSSACTGVVNLPFTIVSVSGTVFNDVNGLTDNDVNGIGIGSPSSVPIYANLVNNGGNVVATQAIAANGTYTFADVTPNQIYTMVLSTVQGTLGNSAPTTSLPSGWVNTGESPNNATSDGLVDGKQTIVVLTTSVPNVDFGIQQPPTAGTNTQPSQVNPGGTTFVTIPSNAFSGTDPNPGIVTGIRIISFPSNTTTIKINSISYTSATWPVAGIILPTNSVGVPTQTVEIDPIDGSIVVNIPYKTIDNAIAESLNTGFVDKPFTGINISGNVFNDQNGPANVDGTPLGIAGTAQLYANLNDVSGNVVATQPVSAAGTFNFINVSPNLVYKVVLSTTQGVVSSPAPTPMLPFGWTNVSEDCCDNIGNDGATNGELTVTVGITNQINVNFGIHQPMSLGNTVWNDINQDGLNNNGELGIANAVVKLYRDANKDNIVDGPAIDSTITSPTGLYLFNNLDTSSYIVGVFPPVPASGPNYKSTSGAGQETNPNLDVDNNDNGVVSVGTETRSNYITLLQGTEPKNEIPNNDNTKPDSNANLTLDFAFYQPIKIAGNVYKDENGPTDVDGTPIGLVGTNFLYANLINTAGNVVAVQQVSLTGTYEFSDVSPNQIYKVVLTISPGTVSSPAPSAALPFGWTNVSEDCCDNVGNDGTTDGETLVVIVTSDKSNVNFGVHQPMSVGNQVFNDINQNGIKDNGEVGIPNAAVKLYLDVNQDNIADGPAVQTAVTDGAGLYLFDNLDANSYIIGVVPPATTGSAYVSSVIGEESNPNLNVDNNDNGVVTVGNETRTNYVVLLQGTEPTNENPNNDNTKPDANSNLSIDFAFYQPIMVDGNVYYDDNGPMNVDGTPIAIAGTTQLHAILVNSSGVVAATMPINPNGTYQFSDVSPNKTYKVVLSTIPGIVTNAAPPASLPVGWQNVAEDCCDNIGNDGNTNGETSVVVGTSNKTNVNFGIRQPLAVGNLVWIDTNKNGVRDAGELPLVGSFVRLYNDVDSNLLPDGPAIDSMTTGSNGLYVFEGLNSGNYIVGVTPPLVINGTYESPITGQEVNPNLNVDNNDNGINKVGMEVRSGTITLAAQTEPINETPNNSTALDFNANLTLDFAFYVCPNEFAFDSILLCASSTVNLIALEPAGFTGGTWTKNSVVVATPTAVGVGNYLYTYVNGTCTATGSLKIVNNVPDYAPTIQIDPNSTIGIQPVTVTLTIQELLNRNSCSEVYVLVPKLLPRYNFVYDSTMTTIGFLNEPINNTDWQFFENANPNYYIWKYKGNGGLYPSGGTSKIGYIGTYNPNNTDGQSTFSVQIFQGSGGETNPANNTDSEILNYIR